MFASNTQFKKKPPFSREPVIADADTYISEESNSKLFSIMQTGNYNEIKSTLSSYKYNIKSINENNDTIVHILLNGDNSNINSENILNILRLLKSFNIYLNNKNKAGLRPIHLACKMSDYRIANFLLEEHMSLDIKDSLGKTPFHYAIEGSVINAADDVEHPIEPETIKIPKNLDKLSDIKREINQFELKRQYIIEYLKKHGLPIFNFNVRHQMNEYFLSDFATYLIEGLYEFNQPNDMNKIQKLKTIFNKLIQMFKISHTHGYKSLINQYNSEIPVDRQYDKKLMLSLHFGDMSGNKITDKGEQVLDNLDLTKEYYRYLIGMLFFFSNLQKPKLLTLGYHFYDAMIANPLRIDRFFLFDRRGVSNDLNQTVTKYGLYVASALSDFYDIKPQLDKLINDIRQNIIDQEEPDLSGIKEHERNQKFNTPGCFNYNDAYNNKQNTDKRTRHSIKIFRAFVNIMSIDETYVTSNFDEDIAKQIKETYGALYDVLMGVWVNWYKDISRKLSGVNNFYIGENNNDRGYIGEGSDELASLNHFFARTFHTNIYNLLSKSSNNFNKNDNVDVGGGGANQLDQSWRNILQSMRVILYRTVAGDATILEKYNNNEANSKLNDDIVLFFYLFIGIRSCGNNAAVPPDFYRDNENHIYDNIINNQLNNIIIKIKRNEILINGEMNSILDDPPAAPGAPGLDPQPDANPHKTYIYNILKYIPKLIWIANNQINYIEEIEKLLQENMEVNVAVAVAGGDIRSPTIKQQIIDISKIIIIAYKNKRVIYNKDNIGKDISSNDSSFIVRNITDDLNMFIADGIKDTKKLNEIIKGVNIQNANHSEYNLNDCPSNQYRNEHHYFNTSTYGTYRNGNQFPQNQCKDMIKDYYTFINDKIKEEIGTNRLEENKIKEQMLKYINSSDLYIYDKEHLQANMFYENNGFYPKGTHANPPAISSPSIKPADFGYIKINPANLVPPHTTCNHTFNNITIINMVKDLAPAGAPVVAVAGAGGNEYYEYAKIVNNGGRNLLHEKLNAPLIPIYEERIISDHLKLFMVGLNPEHSIPKCGTLDEKYLFEKFNYGIEIPNNQKNCNMTPESLYHKYHPHLHNLKHVFYNHWLLDKIFGLDKEGQEEKEKLMEMMLKEDSKNKQKGGSSNNPSGPSGSFNFNIKKKVYDKYNKTCLTFLFLFINKLMRIDRYVYDEENFENEYLQNDCIKETIYLIFFNAILNRYKSEFADEPYDLDKATIHTDNGITVYPNPDLRKDETPTTIINHKFIILNKTIRNLLGCKDSVRFNNLLFH
ncbi:ankyrin repeat domain-containing protein, partial [bacterium]|nr:ankyrin repeat domain-containing protein [bacterium]